MQTTLETQNVPTNRLSYEETSSLQTTWYTKPETFFEGVLGITMWEKQHEIVESIKHHRRTSIRSCNSAGKTWSISRIALWFLFTFPHSLVINTAPTHRQVENQFWRNLRRAHKTTKYRDWETDIFS